MTRPTVLLVNPWIHDFAAYDMWAKPMGLLVLATVLRQNGWEPRLVDCLDPDHPNLGHIKGRKGSYGHFHREPIAKPEELAHIPRTFSRYGVPYEIIRNDLLSMPRPEAILVTSLMTYWYRGVQETVALLRAVFPGVPLMLGGIYASLMPEHARRKCRPDELVAGPGESRLMDALSRLTGISLEADPHHSQLELKPSFDLLSRVRFLPLLTSRGCPFQCSYCASRTLVPAFVRRSPDEVVAEVVDTVDRYGIRDIALYDDAFLVEAPRYATPILEAVADRVPGTRWHAPNGLHAFAIDRSVARAMKRAGFETIRIGLESSSDEFHARTGRKTDMAAFVAAVTHLKEAGFSRKQIGVYLLVGLPGQSRASIEDDVDRVLSVGAYPKLAEYSPIPGTSLWNAALQNSKYPIEQEPLFQNCTLLSAAEPDVDEAFLRQTRNRMRTYLND
jgi:radical SAM superfamily enzyme YgiQ (UPF0313 family)